jgi:heme exporter protein B
MNSIIWALIRKEAIIEWRNKSMFWGVLLYTLLIVFFIFFSFRNPDPISWSTLLWIMLLFASANAVAKSFLQEPVNRWRYYYTLHNAPQLFIAKTFYNFFLLLFISLATTFIYSVFVGFPVISIFYFFVCLILGSFCLSTLFSIMSAIAGKVGKSSSLVTILSLPLAIPLVAVISNFSKKTLSWQPTSFFMNDIILLTGINILILLLGYILFTFVWNE